MSHTLSSLYARVFSHYPHPSRSHAAVLLADWITLKEEYEENPTASSFERYQHSTTQLLNDEEIYSIISALANVRHLILGD
jgi:hypothetical protein